MSRILVVDDEPRIAEFVARGLQSRGYDVDCAHSPDQARNLAANQPYDLVILDLVMPGTDGMEFLQELGITNPRTQVLALSSMADLGARVRALDLGASDHLAKPFALEELLALVRVRLREGGHRRGSGEILARGQIRLDVDSRRVTTGVGTFALPGREFLLLRHLMQAGDDVCTRNELLSAVWGYEHDPGSNVVEVYVARLRTKIGAESIRTIRSVGYRLAS